MSETKQVGKGSLLIAEPFLGDPNFEKGVVLLCEHNTKGTFGFVINQKTELMIGDVLEESIYQEVPLFLGGPVEKNTLHFIHRRPELITGGSQITQHIYWGGDFDEVRNLLNFNKITQEDIRFFIGYSGWSAGQLDEELNRKSWIISKANADFIFSTPSDRFWREVLMKMGGEYRSIAHYPTDPRLN